MRLFEARPRLGGRAHSVTHDGGVLELGAQWLHGACHANPLAGWNILLKPVLYTCTAQYSSGVHNKGQNLFSSV